ncbi:S8 family peptidase [Thermoactinomyces daqus]|uniref:S8 family peptidase n=1 Tax=Thermoactinomyces daqus TaxID=1329516 RepID=A0A7W2AHI7_9BACL|nr:S8 family peptidase [Thermoactinomyces daqus]MBA4541754.1 S8 family peptidase [Thermoactinomyces daqus]
MSAVSPEGRYTFVFRSVAKPEIVKQAGGQVHHVGKYSSTVTASFKSPKNAFKLKKDPDLISIQEDRLLRLPFFKIEKVFSASRRINDKRAVNSQVLTWNVARVLGKRRLNNGTGVRVGVIDTGLDFHHPDLVSNIKGGVNVLSPFLPPQDDNGHGTHIAGIIGALNNHFGVVGIAPKVSLYAIKVLNSAGHGTISNLIKGIEWAIANRMHILNISISGGQTIHPALAQAIAAAVSRGILIVAAAGNNGNASGKGDTVSIPARISPVISVAALNKLNRRDSYSATGKVDIAAPGTGILSTYFYSRYAVLSGTSIAAAHVTGVLAIYRAAFPRATSAELKAMLYHRAIDLPPAGRDPLTGVGLVQGL